MILTLVFHSFFVTLVRQNSKVCWLSRFLGGLKGFSLKGHPLWAGDVVFYWSEPGVFSIEHSLGSYSFFSSRGLPIQVWIYFLPETREFLLLILSFIDWSSGLSHLDQMWNWRSGGSFNFQSHSIELLLCCEWVQRVNSTLNQLSWVDSAAQDTHQQQQGSHTQWDVYLFFI